MKHGLKWLKHCILKFLHRVARNLEDLKNVKKNIFEKNQGKAGKSPCISLKIFESQRERGKNL